MPTISETSERGECPDDASFTIRDFPSKHLTGITPLSGWCRALDSRIDLHLPENSAWTKQSLFADMYNAGWSVGDAIRQLMQQDMATLKR